MGSIRMTAAIVLAAGTSSRFGRTNKLLTRVQGAPVLAHAIASLQGIGGPVVVVTGYRSRRVIAAMRRTTTRTTGVRFVINRDFRAGLSTSIRTGLQALPAFTGRVLLCLGDMPAIDPRLVASLRQVSFSRIDYVRPVHAGCPGHPVLVSRRLFGALRSLRGDRGAQAVLAKIAPTRRYLLAWHKGCLVDADRPAALRQATRVIKRARRHLGERPKSP